MNRVIGGGLVVLVCVCGLAGTADAAVTKWKVKATLTGSYKNDVTATPDARCAAHYAESTAGIKVTLSSSKAVRYDPVARNFVGPLRYRVSGSWAVTGEYNAQVAQPDGTLACAPNQTLVACTAKVVFEDGHRTSTTGSARLAVDGTAHDVLKSRITAPRLTEQYADAGTPPPSWPDVCTLQPSDESIPASPLFGLSATTVLDRALAAPIRIPTSKLRRRHAFTVRAAPAHPASCPAEGFSPCSESGAFRLSVTLVPV
jgi:hypothetical protein